jgi:hypothetical protein
MLMGYIPTGEPGTAVVVKFGDPPTEEDVSPLTKQVSVAVKAGLATLSTRDTLLAVAVSTAGAMVIVCTTGDAAE